MSAIGGTGASPAANLPASSPTGVVLVVEVTRQLTASHPGLLSNSDYKLHHSSYHHWLQVGSVITYSWTFLQTVQYFEYSVMYVSHITVIRVWSVPRDRKDKSLRPKH